MNGNADVSDLAKSNYYYAARYPEEYRTNLHITKFERSYEQNGSNMKYTFVDAFPISISAMPVSYDSSNLLKCTVGFTYLRYFTGDTEVLDHLHPMLEMQWMGADPYRLVIQNLIDLKSFRTPDLQGEGLYDSATGQFLLSTVDQIRSLHKVRWGME